MTLTDLATLAVSIGIIIFLGWMIVHYSSLIYSSLHGAPYIPTRARELRQILTAANLSPGMRFIDVGCGDGRLVHLAAREFSADAHGIDINPVLIHQARAKTPPGTSATFTVANLHDTPYGGYDVIYLYLLPPLLRGLAPVIMEQATPGTLVISHWFRISAWEAHLEHQITAGKYPTFYYRMPSRQ